jgi:hypothetical protein
VNKEKEKNKIKPNSSELTMHCHSRKKTPGYIHKYIEKDVITSTLDWELGGKFIRGYSFTPLGFFLKIYLGIVLIKINRNFKPLNSVLKG